MSRDTLAPKAQLESNQRLELIIGLLCGVAVVLIFSSFTLVSRLGLKSYMDPMDIAGIRFSIAGILMLPFFIRYRFSNLRFIDAAIMAFLGGLGFALFAYNGFARAPAAHGAVLLHGTIPLFTILFGAMFVAERVSRNQYIGAGLILIGIGAMGFDSLNVVYGGMLVGDASYLAASVCWAGYGLKVRQLGLKSIHATAVVTVLSAVIYLPVWLAFSTPSKLLSAPLDQLLIQIGFQGVVVGTFSIFVYTRAVESLGAVRTALLTTAVPAVTVLAAVPMLGEYPSWVAGAGVIVASIGMAAALRRR